MQEDLAPEDCAAMMERASIIALRHAASELAPLLGVTLSLAITAEQLQSGVFAGEGRRHAQRGELPDPPPAASCRHHALA